VPNGLVTRADVVGVFAKKTGRRLADEVEQPIAGARSSYGIYQPRNRE